MDPTLRIGSGQPALLTSLLLSRRMHLNLHTFARPRWTRALLLALVVAAAAASPAGAAGDAMARGDEAWRRRAEGRSELNAAPRPAAEAVAAYGEALEGSPSDLVARWKLMRALVYQGEYVLENRSARLATFARGLDLGERGIDQLAEVAGGRSAFDRLELAGKVEALAGADQAAEIYYWTCIHWGLWGRETGALAAVRRGVAGKVRDYAEIVVGLDETLDDGGPHRILGRLHFEAPRVPFVTGWIDRDTARHSLERAAELAPDSALSRLHLIEMIHRYEPDRRDEAVEMLRELLTWKPRADRPLEDARALASARAVLEEWTR